jgi:pimeloyl-ACP methyl ester carboxylesterase
VFAIDLPGFGLSDRSDRHYDPRLMTDALHALAVHVRIRCGAATIEALASSLGCKFLARAAMEQPTGWGRLAFVSPTGLNGTTPRRGAPGSTRGKPWLHALLSSKPWSGGLFSQDIHRIYEGLSQPVWMSHGVRGDFKDFRGKRLVQDRGNWRTTVYQTGALPYFEAPSAFFSEFDALLASQTPARAAQVPQREPQEAASV